MFGIDDALLAAIMSSAAAAAPAAATAAEAAPAAAGALSGAASAGAGAAGAMGLNEALAPLNTVTGGLDALDAGMGADLTKAAKPAMDLTGKMQGAHMALRMASKLIPNKQARQTLDLLSLASGMGASGGDMTKNPGLVMDPLNDIAQMTQEEDARKQQKLSQALSPLAPSTQAQPTGGPVSSTPSTRQAMAAMPSVRLTSDMPADERLRILYSGGRY
jgi:hypothetical protein